MNETKRCPKCGEMLPVSEFSKNKRAKDGLQSKCKGCCNAYNRVYYKKNLEKHRERVKAWRKNNPEKVRESQKAYYKNNPEKARESQKAYREKNSEKVRESIKAYRENNPEKVRESQKAYREKRMKTDPLFKMAHSVRALTGQAFRRGGWEKSSPTQQVLGCSFDEFKKHIESQFEGGMSWDNQGEWHYDHIIPLASADTEDRVTELSHYTNLQPLWADENLAKRDMMPEEWEKMKPEWEKRNNISRTNE